VMAPRRPPTRPGKDAGKAAVATPVGTPTTQVRAVSKGDARKRRIKAPFPAPQTGMQLHTADGIRKISPRASAMPFCAQPTWPTARCGHSA
jgi:hypothetical protein